MHLFVILLLSVFVLSSCKPDPSTTIFSDGFEDYTVGEIPRHWYKTGAGQVHVDTTRSHSGSHSVHFISGESYKNRAFLGLNDRSIFPLRDNRYYASMYMWIDEVSPDGIHWTMLQSSGRVTGAPYSCEIRYGGQHHKKLMANYDTKGVSTDCWQHSSTELPEKKWVKVSWYFDGPENLMKIWLDDQLIEDIVVQDQGSGCIEDYLESQWVFPTFENVVIGWVDYQTGGGERELWIDDFVMYDGLPNNLL